MRKIVFLLCIIMLLSLLACQKPTIIEMPPEKMLAEAIENVKKQDSADIDIAMDMTVNALGNAVNIPMTASVQSTGLLSGNPTSYAEVHVMSSGRTGTTKAYIKDGYAYIWMPGKQFKTEVGEMGSVTVIDTDAVLQEIPEEVMLTAVVTKSSDGALTFHMEFPTELFEETYGDLLNDIGESASELGFQKIAVDYATVEIILAPSGNLYEFRLDCQMALISHIMITTVSTPVSVDLSVKYNDPTRVTVTPLDGYENYPEI